MTPRKPARGEEQTGAGPPPQTTKSEIRRALRARGGSWEHLAEELASRVLALPEVTSAKVVMAYVSLPDEAPTSEILPALLREGKILLLPRVKGEEIEPVRVTDLSRDLAPGYAGIAEPASWLEPWKGRVDALILPGLAFDEQGTRLGRGGGHYDRLLARLETTRIGLATEAQLLSHLPSEPHDARVHVLVTEARVIRFPVPPAGPGKTRS